MLKLRKLVINNWVHVSLGLVSGDKGMVMAAEMLCTYLGGTFLLGCSNGEKWGDHRIKNLFISNSVGLSMCDGDGPIETVKYI